MKLIQIEDYLLLIEEVAEIKKGDYILEKESIINIFPDYLTDLDECSKIIAYRPLTKEAKELDLPVLPNPFEEVDIRKLAEDKYGRYEASIDFPNKYLREGYKAAQTKQFTLEDIKKAIEMARMTFPTDKLSCDRHSTEEIIQSLSTQQSPKEFIPEYEYQTREGEWKSVLLPSEWFGSDEGDNPKRLKTIVNSEGKGVSVGTYKY